MPEPDSGSATDRSSAARPTASSLAGADVGADAALEPPVICFSAQDFWYHNRAHSDVQLMRRLAATRKVLFVNSLGLRLPLPGRTTQPWRRMARKVASVSKFRRRPWEELTTFEVLSPLVLPLYGSRFGRALNGRLVSLQVRWACRRLGMVRPTAVVTIPSAVDVLPHLALDGVVFNRSDKHSEFTETDQDVVRAMETRLLQESDAVVYVSHALMEDEAGMTEGRAAFLDHGVDLELFALLEDGAAVDPDELRDVPHPRVGFFGGLDDYVVDFSLLERLARELPEVHLVLVGDATCSMDRLTQLPNVTWIPRRAYERIPEFGRAFDVAIMPWLRNEWIRLCNPVKLKEYLALGLPVVSTDFPEVHRYADVVHIAGDPAEFVDLVRRSLRDGGAGTRQTRRAAVANTTWDAVALRLAHTCAHVRTR